MVMNPNSVKPPSPAERIFTVCEIFHTPLERYALAPRVIVPKWAIERAIRSLDHIEGLALVRAAFGDGHETVELVEAKDIYDAIMGRGV